MSAPNVFARKLQDALVDPAAFALPASASSSTQSAAIDLGADEVKPDTVELELSVPALSSTIVPDTRTVTLIVESSTTSNFAAIARTLASKTLTGAGGAGIAASKLRARLPSDCERYVRFKVTFGASTTDGSAKSATGKVLF